MEIYCGIGIGLRLARTQEHMISVFSILFIGELAFIK